jgi:hypothetical protein
LWLFFEIGSYFFPQASPEHDSPILGFCYSWDDRHVPPHPAFFCWDGISQTFFSDWPGTALFPISVTGIAGITDVSLQHLAK